MPARRYRFLTCSAFFLRGVAPRKWHLSYRAGLKVMRLVRKQVRRRAARPEKPQRAGPQA
ncbi:hypothetical protein CYJ16_08385 [Actinotignum timonense]|nr:hypothetical protein CYJ16_08385 [Actinotignum timonense]